MRAARALFALNALVAAVALVFKFAYALVDADPRFATKFGRFTNELCYFTIETNMLVVAVCVLLAIRLDRSSELFWLARVIALVSITITGIVYHTILASENHFHGLEAVGDALAHTVSPLLYVITWMVVGPRGRMTGRSVLLMLSFPLTWVVFTMVRGAIIHLYPYGFVDVGLHGYAAVTITIVGLMIGALAMAAAALVFDRRVSARRTDAAGAPAVRRVR